MNSTVNNTLAFFENLITSSTYIDKLKLNFYSNIESLFTSTHIDTKNELIIIHDYDDFNQPKNEKEYFIKFLKTKLEKEKSISINLIKLQSSKILSSINTNSLFFKYTENTLINLNNKSRTFNYSIVNDVIIEIMQFYYTEYNKFHNFSTEFLNTMSIYRDSKEKTKAFSFNWKSKNKSNELTFLYESLINANPPFINSSKETFIKAFTNQQLDNTECIKWICKNVKNKKTISKVTLVSFLEILLEKKFIHASGYINFNKTVKTIFCYPNGEHLKDIKGSKKIKSKNPSRLQEIKDIIDRLTKID